jgi:hypothetical protein
VLSAARGRSTISAMRQRESRRVKLSAGWRTPASMLSGRFSSTRRSGTDLAIDRPRSLIFWALNVPIIAFTLSPRRRAAAPHPHGSCIAPARPGRANYLNASLGVEKTAVLVVIGVHVPPSTSARFTHSRTAVSVTRDRG